MDGPRPQRADPGSRRHRLILFDTRGFSPASDDLREPPPLDPIGAVDVGDSTEQAFAIAIREATEQPAIGGDRLELVNELSQIENRGSRDLQAGIRSSQRTAFCWSSMYSGFQRTVSKCPGER